jgi:hypothetical protein
MADERNEPRYRKTPDGRWPPEARTDALMRYQIDGLANASRHTGVPEPTIVDWAKQAGIHAYALADDAEQTRAKTMTLNWEQRRRHLANRSADVAAAALERMHQLATSPRRATGRDFQAFAVGYAVLVDKAKLLTQHGSGGPGTDDPAARRAELDGMLHDLEHQAVRHDE